MQEFVEACQKLSNVTYGNDIMLTMGTDFTYSNAFVWCGLPTETAPIAEVWPHAVHPTDVWLNMCSCEVNPLSYVMNPRSSMRTIAH